MTPSKATRQTPKTNAPAAFLVVCALGAIIAGVIGFFFFEEYIYSNPKVLAATVCCIPAGVIAVVLIFLASMFSRVQQIRFWSRGKDTQNSRSQEPVACSGMQYPEGEKSVRSSPADPQTAQGVQQTDQKMKSTLSIAELDDANSLNISKLGLPI